MVSILVVHSSVLQARSREIGRPSYIYNLVPASPFCPYSCTLITWSDFSTTYTFSTWNCKTVRMARGKNRPKRGQGRGTDERFIKRLRRTVSSTSELRRRRLVRRIAGPEVRNLWPWILEDLVRPKIWPCVKRCVGRKAGPLFSLPSTSYGLDEYKEARGVPKSEVWRSMLHHNISQRLSQSIRSLPTFLFIFKLPATTSNFWLCLLSSSLASQ